MTDRQFPDAVPHRALEQVLRAAAQPATEDELAGMSAFVQAFTAEVAASTVTPLRSGSRFAGRVTRRAAAITAITLFAAGTAAAAAGGALPNPFHGAPPAQHADHTTASTTGGKPVSTDDQGGDGTRLAGTTAKGSKRHGNVTTSGDATDTSLVLVPGLRGRCIAFTHGGAKRLTAHGFAQLKAAADQAGQSIEAFCATVLATGPGTPNPTIPTTSQPSGSQPTISLPTGSGPSGPGKGHRPFGGPPSSTPPVSSPPGFHVPSGSTPTKH